MIAIVANPNALHFNSNTLKHITDTLKSKGFKVDVFFTQKAGDGTDIVSAIDGKYRIIATYGGDGIVNEVINGTLNNSALAVLPGGTTNVLAIELFGKSSLKLALDALIKGKTRRAYTCSTNSRRFILMAGIGFDAESVFLVRPKAKKRLGKLEYVISGVRAYLSKNSDCFQITINNRSYLARWAIVSNAKRYAGKFKVSPNTDIFDRKTDVFLCPCFNKYAVLPYCNGMLFGGLHKLIPKMHITTENEIIIEGEPHMQIDGDYFSKTNATIKLDKSINIIAP